jgi:hypothetical protein
VLCTAEEFHILNPKQNCVNYMQRQQCEILNFAPF